MHQGGLLLQRLYFADEVHNSAEIDRGAEPKIRDQERTLAERLISELSGTEFHPENYEDEYRKRLLKAVEQKVAGQEIERIEVEARPPTSDLVATLKASLGRKELAKTARSRSEQEATPEKRPARPTSRVVAALNERAHPDDGSSVSSGGLSASGRRTVYFPSFWLFRFMSCPWARL